MAISKLTGKALDLGTDSIEDFASTGIDDNTTAEILNLNDSGATLEFTNSSTVDALTLSNQHGSGGVALQYSLPSASFSQAFLDFSPDGGFSDFVLGTGAIGSQHTGITQSTSGVIKFSTNFNDRMTINSSGDVGIGTTPDTDVRLTVADSGTAFMRVRSTDAAGDAILQLGNATDTNQARVVFLGADESLNFYTSDAKRVTISNTGNVGIGESNPSAKLEVDGDVHITGSGGTKLLVENTAPKITLRDTSAVGAEADEFIIRSVLSQSSGDYEFVVNNDLTSSADLVVMEITGAGNVGINYNNPDVPLCVGVNVGNALAARFGTLGSAKAGDDVFVRLQGQNSSNTNKYIDLRHLVDDGALTINGPTSSLTEILRIDPDGIKFGGDTAAANALDDYEEGTWTPTYTTSVGDSSMTYNAQSGHYVKIGKIVYISCYLQAATVTSYGTGNPRIAGLPYTGSGSNERLMVQTYLTDWDSANFPSDPMVYISSGQSQFRFIIWRDNGTWAEPQTSQLSFDTTNAVINVSGVYLTNQ